jgi:hypothetical protein
MPKRNNKSRSCYCKWHSPHGLHTEASRSFAARTSEKLSGACAEGTKSSQGFYVGCLSETTTDLWVTRFLDADSLGQILANQKAAHLILQLTPPTFPIALLDQYSSNPKKNENNQSDQQRSYDGK